MGMRGVQPGLPAEVPRAARPRPSAKPTAVEGNTYDHRSGGFRVRYHAVRRCGRPGGCEARRAQGARRAGRPRPGGRLRAGDPAWAVGHLRRALLRDLLHGGRRGRPPRVPRHARRGRRVPRHRLPLPRDHRHPGRRRGRDGRQRHHTHPAPDGRRAGRRVRSEAARPRPRPVLLPAQGQAAGGGPAPVRRVGDRPAPRRVRDPGEHPGRRLGREAAARSRSRRSRAGPRTTWTPTSPSTACSPTPC